MPDSTVDNISQDEILMRRISLDMPSSTITPEGRSTRATSFALRDKTSLSDGPSWSRLELISPFDLIECGRKDGAKHKQTVAFAIAAEVKSLGFVLKYMREDCDIGHLVLLFDGDVKKIVWSKLADKTLVLPLTELALLTAGDNPTLRAKLNSKPTQ